jgi:AAHS family benzoate transporter-like MFS transporter
MFLVAVLPLVFLIPLGVKYLPDLRSQHNPEEGTGFRAILRTPYLAVSVVFAAATMATLFAWYGLGTWLPGLMQQAGYNLGSALTFALTLNLGAVVGSILTAWAGDRFGSLPTGVVAAAVAGAALLTIVAAPPVAVVYAMLVLAGIGTHGTQCLIIAAVAGHYPDQLRGTALGWALGIGRIGAVAAPQVGGWMLAAGLGVNSNFIAFALAAGTASALIALAWRLTGRRATSPTAVVAH